ncbi:FAD-dependent oxidoreductase [Microbacterium dauci]|uniref:FAD-dependent monooxygenase n=1 Tax=Microbacterium dauci TaxID=3048008 RepID=A0ABT6ZCD6_9MICO|nr:FAD-dependent monooxygenase [Microbacterium sp. LX3-4]MDJ1113827.1 FAD-dependent monooxygenase [Microbacterium sp. LX3-4]
MLFALDGDTGVLCHRETDGSLHTYLGLRVDEDWLDDIDFADTAAAKRGLLERLRSFHPSLQGLIAHADGTLTPRRIHALRPGFTWEHRSGVTILGDAAHVMSPFAGEGANLAMHDGSSLALAIASRPDDIDAAVRAYEDELFIRSELAATEKHAAITSIQSMPRSRWACSARSGSTADDPS